MGLRSAFLSRKQATDQASPLVSPPSKSATEPSAASFEPSVLFHVMTHELRTVELERVPKGAGVALSVGAQGRWYFDWFEAAYGELDRHIGVEAFEPKPADLPPYATWIANTANHMTDVRDESVDLVFAGQTTEHLWADELVGFLDESRRVLRPGGYLVLDSPNRLVTEHLRWSHGGHTIELSLAEMIELLDLAGFDVLSTSGVWHCVWDGRVHQLEEQMNNHALLVRRVALGRDDPDACFIWWINAAKSNRIADVTKLRNRCNELFASHWNIRVMRGLGRRSDAVTLPIEQFSSGLIAESLPFPLHAGNWAIRVELTEGRWDDLQGFALRIVAPGGGFSHELPLTSADIAGTAATFRFLQPWLLFALQLQVIVVAAQRDAVLALPFDVHCEWVEPT